MAARFVAIGLVRAATRIFGVRGCCQSPRKSDVPHKEDFAGAAGSIACHRNQNKDPEGLHAPLSNMKEGGARHGGPVHVAAPLEGFETSTGQNSPGQTTRSKIVRHGKVRVWVVWLVFSGRNFSCSGCGLRPCPSLTSVLTCCLNVGTRREQNTQSVNFRTIRLSGPLHLTTCSYFLPTYLPTYFTLFTNAPSNLVILYFYVLLEF